MMVMEEKVTQEQRCGILIRWQSTTHTYKWHMDPEPPQWFTQTSGLARFVWQSITRSADDRRHTQSDSFPAFAKPTLAFDSSREPQTHGDRKAAGMRLTESGCGNAKIGTKRDG